MTTNTQCVLCQEQGRRVVWQNAQWRLVHAQEAAFPAFYRLIAQQHYAEWSDVPASQRVWAMEAVTAVEKAMLQQLRPTKINLATLGNVVPHVHWHIIARFDWDSHFPNPVWGAAVRRSAGAQLVELQQKLPALERSLVAALQAL